MNPWLSQTEVDDLCEPLTQFAAQHRFLRTLGLTVREKPNGAPLVMRTCFDEVMHPAGKARKQAKTQPNRKALSLAYSRG